MDRFITIARIVKKRGIRGELAAEVLTSHPDRFSLVHQVRIYKKGREYREELESYWFHGERVILKFRGRDRPEETEELIGGEVQIPEEDRLPPPENSFYHADLIGCRILEGGRLRGVVTDIFEASGEVANLVVQDDQMNEFMIPLTRAFIREIDIDSKTIQVELPKGLTEV